MLKYVFFAVWFPKDYLKENNVLESTDPRTCLQQFINFSSLVENLFSEVNLYLKRH